MKNITLPLLLSVLLCGAGCSTVGPSTMDVGPVPENTQVMPEAPSNEKTASSTVDEAEIDARVDVETDATVTTKTVSVNIQNFAFSQPSLTVNKGDKIVFTQKDTMQHTVTADKGAFDSGYLSAGQTFTLDTSTLAPGTYGYHCKPHPDMTGTIIVK